MSKKERKNHTRREIADAICTAIEDLVYKGRITRHDATKWYGLLSSRLMMPDLKVPITAVEEIMVTPDLKERIKMRLERGFLHKRVDIPGDPVPREFSVNQRKEDKTHQALVKQIEKDTKDEEPLEIIRFA
jgi:hypothetical protein